MFNPTEETIAGTIAFWKKLEQANQVDLNEKIISKADFEGNAIKVTAKKNKILTYEIFMKQEKKS